MILQVAWRFMVEVQVDFGVLQVTSFTLACLHEGSVEPIIETFCVEPFGNLFKA